MSQWFGQWFIQWVSGSETYRDATHVRPGHAAYSRMWGSEGEIRSLNELLSHVIIWKMTNLPQMPLQEEGRRSCVGRGGKGEVRNTPLITFYYHWNLITKYGRTHTIPSKKKYERLRQWPVTILVLVLVDDAPNSTFSFIPSHPRSVCHILCAIWSFIIWGTLVHPKR